MPTQGVLSATNNPPAWEETEPFEAPESPRWEDTSPVSTTFADMDPYDPGAKEPWEMAAEEFSQTAQAQEKAAAEPLLPANALKFLMEHTPNAYTLSKMLPLPEGVREGMEGYKDTLAEGAAGMTSPNMIASAPVFAVPYLGPALAMGLGAKSVGEGAGKTVAAIEQGNARDIGSGLGEVGFGASMVVPGAMHAFRKPSPVIEVETVRPAMPEAPPIIAEAMRQGEQFNLNKSVEALKATESPTTKSEPISSSSVVPEKGGKNAIQEPRAEPGVLREERPEVEVPRVVEQDQIQRTAEIRPQEIGEQVAGMSPDQFMRWSKDQKGGFTTAAYEYGKTLATPEQIARIKELEQATERQMNDALTREDAASAMDLANKKQFFTETLESATGAKLEKAKTTSDMARVKDAGAKMQAEVASVAKTEGVRPAKEIKSELVTRLEEAIASAPEESALSEKQLSALNNPPKPVGYQSAQEYKGGGKYEERLAATRWADKENESRRSEWVKQVKDSGLEQVSIEIPGDGSFTVWNTKEALTALHSRAKRLATNAGATEAPRSTGIPKEDADWVRKQFAEQSAKNDPANTFYIGFKEPNGPVKWEPVAGKAIKIPGFEEFEFFVHKKSGGYGITEGRTGQGLGVTESSAKKAEAAALTRLNSKPEMRRLITEVIENKDKAGEISPRYTSRQSPQSMGGQNPLDVGEVPKAQLAQMTDSLKTLANNPKGTATEAFDLGKAVAEAKDRVSSAAEGLRAAGEYAKLKLEGKPVVTDWQKTLGERHLELSESAVNARRFTKEATRAIPDKLTREAISDWIDAGGDAATLTRAASETKPAYKAGYEKAKALTPEQRTIAENLKNYFERRLEDAQKAGILEDGIENYIHRLYEQESPFKKAALAELRSGLFTGQPTLAKKRVFEYDFEAEKAGLKPIKDFVQRVAAYDLALNKAIADRRAVKSMMEIKMPDGRPMIDVGGGGKIIEAPDGGTDATFINRSAKRIDENNPKADRGDYKPYDHPALRKWKWAMNDAAGKPVFVQGDVLIHPDALRQMESLLGRSRIRQNPVGRAALNVSSTIKQTMLDLSGFHQVQIAVHGVEHRTFKPVKEIDFTNPDVRGLIKGGAVVGETSGHRAFSEGLSGSSLTKHVPWLGERVQAYQSYLFEDFIPRVKVAMGLHALERNRSRFPKLSEPELYKMTAEQMNAAFGELNYEMMGRSKTVQDALRLTLLAPDFLEARSRFVAQAFTKYGAEQRQALVLGAATMFIFARIANKILDDEYHFEPKNWFNVVYNGKSYGLRTIQGDLIHMVTDPGKFTNHRLNPIYGKTALEFVTGRDYFGRKRDVGDKLKDIAMTPVPISVRGLMSGREQTLLESFLNSFGFVTKRNSPASDISKLATEWREKNKVRQVPGEFIYDADKDPYRKIKLAAEYYDVPDVRREIEAALSEGLTKPQIRKHFVLSANHRFAGSAANERKFFESLTADQKDMYRKALAERKKIKETVDAALR